uniref:Ig-like domain-containing protein n=1 Tax=Esox lucius TaxID=8010 RepID=A0A6Q2Y9H7_ESOLU
MLALDLIQLFICLILVVLGDAQTEVKTVKGIEGQTVTLNTGLTGVQDDVIYWTYGPAGAETIIATLNVGRNISEYNERLHLDAQSGSLTIKSLTINENGIFTIQIIRGKILTQTFNLIVYGRVSILQIYSNQSPPIGRMTCPVECSVENGKELTLSWYNRENKLNQTSNPDTSITLYLPLVVKEEGYVIYRCVADNPVSNQTIRINSTELCPHLPGTIYFNSISSVLFLNIWSIFGPCLIMQNVLLLL